MDLRSQSARLLAVLFAVAAFFQAGHSAYVIRLLIDGAHMPDAYVPVMLATDKFGTPPFYGWQVLAVEGKPYTRASQVQAAIETKRPGDTMSLILRSPAGEVRDVHIKVVPAVRGPSQYVVLATASLLLPLFCFLLGFGVAAIRPRDPLAWLLLGLMLSFAEVSHFASWGWPLANFATAWHSIVEGSWPVWMMLFGIYFPRRLGIDQKYPWLKWLAILAIAGLVALDTVINLTWLNDVAASLPLRRWVGIADRLRIVLAMAAISVFFWALGFKSGMEKDRDARRRLAFVWTGASLSLTPMFIIAVYALVRDRDMFDGVPQWVLFGALLLLPLFPLTLAYVIVVQRAMNLRVAIRMGLKYAMARRGLRIFQAAVVAAIVFAVVRGLDNYMHPATQLQIVGLAALLWFLQRKMAARASDWVDRKFFREAYSSDRILSELSDQARLFTETQPLLDTVTNRIAETLHIPRAAVLLRDGDRYCLVKTLVDFDPSVRCLPLRARTIELLRNERKPAMVYFDDEKSWVNQIDPEERQRLMALHAQVLLPLSGREDLVGVIVLGPKLSEEPYTGSDLRLLQSVGAQTGMALENSELLAKLSAEAARRERINRELEIAREVQERLFPQRYPEVAGIDYFGFCRPALGIGGDYYDFIHLKNGKLGIAIGDVSGKGVSAALLMSNLHASLRGQAMAHVPDLATMMSNINELIFEASASNRYATFFYGEYDPATRIMDFVNAGHNAPMVVRNGECIRLEAGGPVVGLLKRVQYEQMSCQLEPGDVLTGYTDGISEAMKEGDEEWGEENLLASIRTSMHGDAKEMADCILRDADAFTAGAPQYDDMTLSIIKVR